MSDTDLAVDFFTHLQQQSTNLYGNSEGVDVSLMPISTTKPLEEYLKPNGTATSVQPISPTASVPNDSTMAAVLGIPSTTTYGELYGTVAPVSPSTQQVPQVPKSEQYSWSSAPTGEVPPSFGVASCCASCKYFSEDFGRTRAECIKYDYPTTINYSCSSFSKREPVVSLWDEESEAYSVQLDLAKASDPLIQLLSETWQEPTLSLLKQKRIKLNLSQGKYYILDKKTAEIALQFRDVLKFSEQREALLEIVSKFSPESVTQIRQSELYLLSDTQVQQPVNPTLFNLATLLSKEERKNPYEIYEQLYQERYSNGDPYLSTPNASSLGINTPLSTSPVVENLTEGGAGSGAGIGTPSVGANSVSMSGSVTPYSSSGSGGSEVTLGNLPLRNTLYELAGKRVKAAAAKTGTSVTKDMIDTEFQRVLKARGKG